MFAKEVIELPGDVQVNDIIEFAAEHIDLYLGVVLSREKNILP
jgi:hypothetical protein